MSSTPNSVDGTGTPKSNGKASKKRKAAAMLDATAEEEEEGAEDQVAAIGHYYNGSDDNTQAPPPPEPPATTTSSGEYEAPGDVTQDDKITRSLQFLVRKRIVSTALAQENLRRGMEQRKQRIAAAAVAAATADDDASQSEEAESPTAIDTDPLCSASSLRGPYSKWAAQRFMAITSEARVRDYANRCYIGENVSCDNICQPHEQCLPAALQEPQERVLAESRCAPFGVPWLLDDATKQLIFEPSVDTRDLDMCVGLDAYLNALREHVFKASALSFLSTNYFSLRRCIHVQGPDGCGKAYVTRTFCRTFCISLIEIDTRCRRPGLLSDAATLARAIQPCIVLLKNAEAWLDSKDTSNASFAGEIFHILGEESAFFEPSDMVWFCLSGKLVPAENRFYADYAKMKPVVCQAAPITRAEVHSVMHSYVHRKMYDTFGLDVASQLVTEQVSGGMWQVCSGSILSGYSSVSNIVAYIEQTFQHILDSLSVMDVCNLVGRREKIIEHIQNDTSSVDTVTVEFIQKLFAKMLLTPHHMERFIIPDDVREEHAAAVATAAMQHAVEVSRQHHFMTIPATGELDGELGDTSDGENRSATPPFDVAAMAAHMLHEESAAMMDAPDAIDTTRRNPGRAPDDEMNSGYFDQQRNGNEDLMAENDDDYGAFETGYGGD